MLLAKCFRSFEVGEVVCGFREWIPKVVRKNVNWIDLVLVELSDRPFRRIFGCEIGLRYRRNLRSFSGVGGDSPLPSFLKNIRNSHRFASLRRVPFMFEESTEIASRRVRVQGFSFSRPREDSPLPSCLKIMRYSLRFAENEPCKVCPLSVCRSRRSSLQTRI